MRVKHLLLTAACLVGGLAGDPGLRAHAQEPVKADVLDPQNVEIVRLEVVVAEKRGRLKPGLKREDFAVFEDGKPQPIIQFEAFTRTPPEGPDVPSPSTTVGADEPQQLLPARYVVLAIDDVHMEFSGLVRAQKALARFIEEDLEPEDQIALVTTSGARALSQEFTDDRAVLRQTLSRLSPQERRSGWTGVPYLSEYQAQLIESGDGLALDAAAQEIMAAGIYLDQASAEEEARRKSRAVFSEAVYNSRLTLEALESLIRGLAGLSGRKVLFLVSDGFLTGYSAGSGTSFDLRRIADAGTRAGVVIYALDTRGLPASPPIASASSQTRAQPATAVLIESMRRRSEEATKDAMHALAADTGGSLVEGSNDLRAGLRRLLKDTETYYVLAYEPTNTKRDGAFRRIEVRLPGVRGLQVRTRSGYFAPDDARAGSTPERAQAQARRAEQRQSEMRTALRSLAPLTAIPVQLSADFVSLDQGVTEVVISGHIDLATLPFVQLRDRHQAIVESVAVVYDENGAAVATLETERTAIDAAGEDYQQVLKRGLAYQKAVALKTGRYQVRLAAREDTTGRLGSASRWVEVPDLGPARLTLSSVFLLKESETSGAPSNPDAGLVLQNAQALRRYRRNESLYAQLYAYNPKRDATGATDLVSQAEILRAGVSMGTAAPEPMAPADPNRPPIPHTTRIKLQRFEPGNYELRVTVTDRNAVAMASRRVGFTVY